jgi:hypothetical protein
MVIENGKDTLIVQDCLVFMIELYKKENRIAKLEDIMQHFAITKFRTQTILKILISQGYLDLNYNKYSFSSAIWAEIKTEQKPPIDIVTSIPVTPLPSVPPLPEKEQPKEKQSIMTLIEKYTKPAICLIVFIMEIWVIFILFSDFPGEDLAIGYWVLAAAVVTLYHLYVIMDIKRIKLKTGKYSPGYFVIYALVLLGFLTGGLAFNLKAITAKEQVQDYQSLVITGITQEMRCNIDTINEYQIIVNTNSSAKAKLRYRSMINELTAANAILAGKLPSQQGNTKINSFKIIADTLHINYHIFIFAFLCWVWAMCEVSLFKTAPALPEFLAVTK